MANNANQNNVANVSESVPHNSKNGNKSDGIILSVRKQVDALHPVARIPSLIASLGLAYNLYHSVPHVVKVPGGIVNKVSQSVVTPYKSAVGFWSGDIQQEIIDNKELYDELQDVSQDLKKVEISQKDIQDLQDANNRFDSITESAKDFSQASLPQKIAAIPSLISDLNGISDLDLDLPDVQAKIAQAQEVIGEAQEVVGKAIQLVEQKKDEIDEATTNLNTKLPETIAAMAVLVIGHMLALGTIGLLALRNRDKLLTTIRKKLYEGYRSSTGRPVVSEVDMDELADSIYDTISMALDNMTQNNPELDKQQITHDVIVKMTEHMNK